MSGRAMCAAAAALAVTVLAAGTARADDDEVIDKSMSFVERKGNVVVSTTFTELFDTDAYDKLGSGFQQTVVVRLYVYKEDKELPVSYQLVTFRVAYDLWDEIYVVRMDGTSGQINLEYNTRAEALKRITSLYKYPVADLDDIPKGDNHYLGVVVELNPVSSESLAEIRRWLTRRAGSQSLNRSTSFFGSFVSVFVNPKIPEADRSLRIRSQPFYRPE